MGHCCVPFDVCSVLILCKLWVAPSTFVKAPLCDQRWVQSVAGAEPSMAQCDHDQWEDRNSAWLIIPSAIITSSCYPAQPWRKKKKYLLSDKRVWKTFLEVPLISGCWWAGRRGGERRIRNYFVSCTHKKGFPVSCLINRQNFTPCRHSSSVLPLFFRMLPLGSL